MKQGDVTTQDEAVVLPSAKVTNFTRDMSIASGTQVVTGVGFRPSHIIFQCSVDGGVGRMSIGFQDNAFIVRCISDFENVGAGQWSPINGNSISANLNVTTGYNGFASSYDIDGFTITWTKVMSPTGTLNIQFMAFK